MIAISTFGKEVASKAILNNVSNDKLYTHIKKIDLQKSGSHTFKLNDHILEELGLKNTSHIFKITIFPHNKSICVYGNDEKKCTTHFKSHSNGEFHTLIKNLVSQNKNISDLRIY